MRRVPTSAALAMTVALLTTNPIDAAAQTPARGTGEPPAPATCGPQPGARNVAANTRCFELRTYTVTGETGDINLLHARFRQHSIRILTKHGMDIVGFWQDAERPDTLIYLVAYRDAAAREAAWTAFQSDPEWAKVAKQMGVSLTVESTYMVATDYGPVK